MPALPSGSVSTLARWIISRPETLIDERHAVLRPPAILIPGTTAATTPRAKGAGLLERGTGRNSAFGTCMRSSATVSTRSAPGSRSVTKPPIRAPHVTTTGLPRSSPFRSTRSPHRSAR
eukprot:1244046-Prymnesium_polylepis.2